MITYLGKILALASLAVSVMVMSGAMVSYTNRIDWTEGKGDKPGELAPRKKRIQELLDTMRPADASWREARADLNEQEGYRREDRDWFVTELQYARSGATGGPDPKNAARMLVYNQGALVLEPVGNQPKHLRPKTAPATVVVDRIMGKEDVKFLASLESYLKAETKTRDALILKQQELYDQIEIDRALTNELTPEDGKGLRQRIEDERVKVKLVEEERNLVRPILVNTSIESELIVGRRKELKERIDELEKKAGLAEAGKP